MIKFTKENVEFLEQVDLIVKRFTETKENTDLTRDFREKYIKEIKQWATKTLKKEE